MPINHSAHVAIADDGSPVGADDWNADHVEGVKVHGAVGDGSHDDTTAIQAAIDAAGASNMGGTVVFPRGVYKITHSLIPANNVKLQGVGGLSITNPFAGVPKPGATLVGQFGGPIIDGSAGATSFGMEGLALCGSATDTGSMGIYGELAYSWTLKDIFCATFAEQGIFLKTGIAGHFSNIWIEGACYKRANHVSDYVGAFQLGDANNWFSDAYLEYVVATCSFPATLGGFISGYHCGLNLGLTAGFVNACVGHMSETGIRTIPSSSSALLLVNCRADLNQGHGFRADGAASTFQNCFAYRNSRSANATYSGFRVTQGANVFLGNRIDGIVADVGRLQKYGFEDDSETGNPNSYVFNKAGGYVDGALYHVTSWGTRVGMVGWSGAKLQLDNPPAHNAEGTGTGIIVGTGGPQLLSGSASPEGAITAPVGSIFMRTDGGAGTSIYVKQSGTGNTGWVGK